MAILRSRVSKRDHLGPVLVSSSDPFLCYEGFHVPHSSGLQEASISGSQPKASSMYGLALYEISYEVVSLFIKVSNTLV